MSLVNDMLRDLDKRRHAPKKTVMGEVAPQTISAGKKGWWRYALVAVLLLVIATGVYWYTVFQLDGGNESLNRMPPMAETAPIAEKADNSGAVSAATQSAPPPQNAGTPPEQPPVMPVEEEPAHILDFVVEAAGKGFRLNLVSDKSLFYQVSSQGKRSLRVLIPDALLERQWQGELPRPEAEYFNLFNDADDLYLELELRVDGEFNIRPQLAGENALLVIEVNLLEAEMPDQEPGLERGGAENVVAEFESPEARPALSGPQEDQRGELKTERDLSFEDKDRNLSQEALKLVRSGQLMAAFEMLYEFIGENPEAHKARETLATIFMAQASYGQAQALVEEGLALAPNYAPYKKLRARLFMLNQQDEEALALLLKLQPDIKDDLEYHEILASVMQKTGNHDGAILRYRALLNLDSFQGKWWVGLAISQEATGQAGEALRSYENALRMPELDASLGQYSQTRIRALSRQL